MKGTCSRIRIWKSIFVRIYDFERSIPEKPRLFCERALFKTWCCFLWFHQDAPWVSLTPSPGFLSLYHLLFLFFSHIPSHSHITSIHCIVLLSSLVFFIPCSVFSCHCHGQQQLPLDSSHFGHWSVIPFLILLDRYFYKQVRADLATLIKTRAVC